MIVKMLLLIFCKVMERCGLSCGVSAAELIAGPTRLVDRFQDGPAHAQIGLAKIDDVKA